MTNKVIRLAPSGKDVAVNDGDSILSALERQGYALPNNCRAGACGECKAKVLSGDYDQGMVFSMALTDEELADGFGLMCMAQPTSAVVEIEYGTIDAKAKLFPPRNDVPFVVVDKVERTPKIVELRLRPVGNALKYWPGQYLQLGDSTAGAPPRCYSIANAPVESGELTLLITKVPDGNTSSWVHEQLEAGDQVLVSGPYGTFVGDPATQTPVLLLAAGSGLAPVLGLTDAALRRGFPHQVTLIISAAEYEDQMLQGLLSWWKATHRNFRVITTFTRLGPATATSNEMPIGAMTGRIPAILGDLFSDLANTSIFIAGSPAFVGDCAAAARLLGAEEELLHTERYVDQLAP